MGSTRTVVRDVKNGRTDEPFFVIVSGYGVSAAFAAKFSPSRADCIKFK